MRRLLAILACLMAFPAAAQTDAFNGVCGSGGRVAVTSGLSSSNTLEGIIPSCTVTVYLTGTLTKATLFKDSLGTTLANPFTANALGAAAPGSWLFYAADNVGYDVVMSAGIPPNTFVLPVTLTDLKVGSGGGGGTGGGCSTLGIPTTNGSVTGDNTSTNCGYNNRSGDTATVPADVSTFGYQNGTGNGATNAVLIGTGNGDSLQGGDVIGIGDSNLRNNTGGGFEHAIVLGVGALTNVTNGGSELFIAGNGAGNWLNSPGDVIVIGNGAGGGQSGLLSQLDESIFLGDSAGGHASGTNLVGIGQGAAAQYLPGAADIVGIGNGSGSGFRNTGTFLPTCSPHDVVGIGQAAAAGNCGNDVVAVGDSAINRTGSGGNTGNLLVAIGSHALWHNTTGTHNVAAGNFAGANPGDENGTGSNNTWIGDFSGPNTPTQLSNSTALGYQAANDASNQIVLGNSSVTQFRVPAIKTVSGIGCLQADTSGNITNTGSGCGGGGGSGTVTNFTAPSGGWPSWLNPTVVNSTTSPSLSVTALAIPNSALANSALTINSVICTLGGSCTISGSGAVASVANSDGTLTISPTTGSVVASLALAHANTWTAKQTQPAPLFSDLTGLTQCLHVNTAGQVSGTGADCGAGGGSSAWSALTNPSGNLILTMAARTSTFGFNAATGSSDLFKWTDTVSNTGTGIMGHFTTASGSTETPWQADANGVGWKVGADGSLQGVGASPSTGIVLPQSTVLPTPTAAAAGIYADTAANLQAYENGGAFSRICTAGNLQCGSGGGGGTPQYIAPQAIAGCGVQYVSGLTYTVGACTYSINGVTYNSPLSNITLPAADATNPKIDVIFVDTTGVVQFIQGTPAVTPQQPVVDPSTQLQLTFVLVPATATTPANTTTVTIYDENTEWTSAKGGTSSANVTLASTNNPYHGTVDTEFGVGAAVATTTFAQYTDPSAGTVTLGNYNTLTFYLRNKAAWAKTNSITVQWFNGSTPLGTAVVLSNGAYGFNATGNFTSYQQVSIPTSTFGIANTPATTVRFTVSGSGANLTGFYLDFVTLQGGNGGVVLPATLMNFKGPWSATATYQPNDTVVSGSIGYVALAANTNVAVTTSATWSPLAPAAGAGTVTSVAQTVPSWLSVAGSPVTTAGVLAITAATGQTSHQVLGTCGTATSFAPCALVAADIPAALSSSTSVNGTSIPASVTLAQTIASGTSALGTSAIASGTCATVVTTSATGTATTDVLPWGFNADPTSTTGYIPSASGMLTIIAYPTANNVNFKVCNNTASSITPGAVTLNWRVAR